MDLSFAGSPHTGTTIVAVTYNEGVVLGADSRVSMGSYISNRAADKVTPLAQNIWLLRSGSAADTQATADYGERCFQSVLTLPEKWLSVYLKVCYSRSAVLGAPIQYRPGPRTLCKVSRILGKAGTELLTLDASSQPK